MMNSAAVNSGGCGLMGMVEDVWMGCIINDTVGVEEA